METVQQNGRCTLFSRKFPSNIYSILYGIGAFRVVMRTRLNIEPYSLIKLAKVGFIFIGSNSLVKKVKNYLFMKYNKNKQKNVFQEKIFKNL